MNKKGQALVEFIIILPIFILLLLGSFDIGQIIYTKNNLESIMDTVVTDINNDKNFDEVIKSVKANDNETSIKINSENNYLSIKLEKKVNIIAPGLNRVLGDKYIIEVNRVIPYE